MGGEGFSWFVCVVLCGVQFGRGDREMGFEGGLESGVRVMSGGGVEGKGKTYQSHRCRYTSV